MDKYLAFLLKTGLPMFYFIAFVIVMGTMGCVVDQRHRETMAKMGFCTQTLAYHDGSVQVSWAKCPE